MSEKRLMVWDVLDRAFTATQPIGISKIIMLVDESGEKLMEIDQHDDGSISVRSLDAGRIVVEPVAPNKAIIRVV